MERINSQCFRLDLEGFEPPGKQDLLDFVFLCILFMVSLGIHGFKRPERFLAKSYVSKALKFLSVTI